MRSVPLTLGQLVEGEQWLDRVRARIFEADPRVGAVTFDAFSLLGACGDVVRAEQGVARWRQLLPRSAEPVVILDYGSGV